MVDKKEIRGYGLAFFALIACCLLLTTVLAGGTLTFLGISLKNNWLLLFGIGVVIATLIAFIWKRGRGERNGQKEKFEKESKSQSN